MSKQSEKAAAKKVEGTSEKEATSIIVVSDLPRVHGINASTRATTHEQAVAMAKNDETRNAVADSSILVSFVPGANFFTGAKLKEFGAVKSHPDFLKMVDEGLMRVIDASNASIKKGAEAPDSLVSIDSGPLAISIVQGTMDEDLLKTWQDEETRETVKSAIRTQLKMVIDFNKTHEAAQMAAA